MLNQSIKKMLADELAKATNLPSSEILEVLASPPSKKMGDIAFPCFKLAKLFKKAPNLIASDLKTSLKLPKETISKIETQGAYLNFFYNSKYVAKKLISQITREGKTYSLSNAGNNQKVVIDFSSPNVAKPFHIGHLGSTIIGESLSRIYQHMGYKVIRMNHLGDWGVQNGFQVLAWQKRGHEFKDREPTIEELCDLYVWINNEAKKNVSLDKEARKIFKEIEEGNESHLATWKLFRDITIKDLQKIYQKLDVHFDSYNGESFYDPFIAPMIEKFKAKPGFLIESDGAMVVDLKEYDIEAPCIILKSDGATIYATRDLATAIWRYDNYSFAKNIYVTDVSQSFHFKQIFHALKKFGYSWADNLQHIPYGIMFMRDEKGEVAPMSTRKGTMIPLKELIQKMTSILQEIIASKNPNLNDKNKVAETLGLNAIKFWIQSKNRTAKVIFDWEEATNPQGQTGPYLNYTYARTAGILRKLKEQTSITLDPQNIQSIDNSKEHALIAKLDLFDTAIAKAMEEHEPSLISNYLIELSQTFNTFYFSQKVLNADSDTLRHDRACLVKATQIVLGIGMNLIGLQTVDEM